MKIVTIEGKMYKLNKQQYSSFKRLLLKCILDSYDAEKYMNALEYVEMVGVMVGNAEVYHY